MMDQFSELCRTCLASSKSLESLDTECEQGYSLKFMLTSFCTLQMDDISVMYDNICKDCSSEILRAYNFKLQCEQNDVLLREKAQAVKCEDVIKKEHCVSGVMEISAINNEVDSSLYYSDENEVGGQVIEEDCMGGDEHRDNSEDDDTRNGDDYEELPSKKTKKPLKTSTKTSSTAAQSTTESVVKGECGRKKKPIPEEKAQLIDNSFLRLGYKRVYECPKCGHLLNSFNLIHRHLNKFHSIVLKSVEEFDEICVQERKARGIQESQEEDKGLKFAKKDPMYKCIECPHRCKDIDVMKKHIVQQHREVKFIRCSEENCKFRTHNHSYLINHIKGIHMNKYKFTCDLCNFRTHTKYYFDLHHTTKHLNIRPFACQQCDETFNSKKLLQCHTAMKHEKKLKFFCPTCNKGFYVKYYFQTHLKTHLGIKRHVCEHCGMAFPSSNNVKKHVFTVHTSTSEDRVPCSECPYKAKTIHRLKDHTNTVHRSSTRFQCDYCGKSYALKAGLRSHMYKHLGTYPYKCHSCSFGCNSKALVQRHIMMKHTGERPFKCQYCDYGSVTQKQLNIHMESHLNELKHKCHLCPYAANRRSTLTAHLRTKCRQLKRKPYKNNAAIDFTKLDRPVAKDGEPSAPM